MVDRVFYPADARRYSRGGPLLPPSFTERHRYPQLLQDSRPSAKIMGDRDSGEAPTRKRISVACGRCRKRKIRCSGDPGNGEPCNNCRNAGAETCQFLRVASQEASMLQDRGSFHYDLESSRALQRSTISPPYASSQFGHDISDSMSRYPTSSAMYPYGTRYYQNAASWNPGYADEGHDYSGISYSPSYYAPEPPYTFRMASSAKATAPPQMYAESGSGYQCLQRPPVTIDSPSMSLSTVAAALPPAMPNAERLLPALGQKSMTNVGVSSYHTEPSGTYGMKSAQPNSAESSPTGSVPEISGQYSAYDSSPVSAYTQPSTLPSVNGSHRGSTSTGYGSEAYSVSSTSGSIYDSEPTVRAIHDFGMKCDQPSRRDSESYSISGSHTYTVPPGPVPSPSLAGRGLLQTHGATAPPYMVSGGNHTSATAESSSSSATDVRDHVVNDNGTNMHSEVQRARPTATSLSAA